MDRKFVKATDKLTSDDIQKALMLMFMNQKKHKLYCPRVTNFFGKHTESDVITVSKSSLITEIEIKISRSDYKKDAEKEIYLFNKSRIYSIINKHDFYLSGNGPSSFYIAYPDSLLSKEEVPDWIGLIEIRNRNGYYYAIVVRKAKRLNKVTATDMQILKLGRLLSFKSVR